MLRADRANPSTSVKDWKGRTNLARAWPSTKVSTWLNGGLFADDAAPVWEIIGSVTLSSATTNGITISGFDFSEWAVLKTVAYGAIGSSYAQNQTRWYYSGSFAAGGTYAANFGTQYMRGQTGLSGGLGGTNNYESSQYTGYFQWQNDEAYMPDFDIVSTGADTVTTSGWGAWGNQNDYLMMILGKSGESTANLMNVDSVTFYNANTFYNGSALTLYGIKRQ